MDLYSHPDKKLIEHLKEVGTNAKKIIENIRGIEVPVNVSFLGNLAYMVGIFHDFGKAKKTIQNQLLNKSRIKTKHAIISAWAFAYFLNNYFDKIQGLSEYANDEIKINEGKQISYKNLAMLIGFISIYNHHAGLIKNYNGDSDTGFEFEEEIQKDYKNEICNEYRKELRSIYCQLLENYISKDYVEEFFDGFFNLKKEDFDNFRKKLQDELYNINTKNWDLFFLVRLIYSALLISDRLSAAGIIYKFEDMYVRDIDLENKLNKYYKIVSSKANDKENKLDALRDRIKKAVDNMCEQDEFIEEVKKKGIIKVSLPTGYGKTLIGLKLAAKIISKLKNIRKLYYVLPFLSIIDQVERTLKEVLYEKDETQEDLLLRYDHISFLDEKESKSNQNETEYDYAQKAVLYEVLSRPVILTTFVSFFNFLLKGEKQSAMKFINIPYSVVIIDEIQALDLKYHELVKDLIKLLSREYKVIFIVMSATNPKTVIPDEEAIIIDGNSLSLFDSYIGEEKINRYSLKFEAELLDSKMIAKKAVNLLDKYNKIGVILNTIDGSRETFEHIKELISQKYNTAFINEIIVSNESKNLDKYDLYLFYLSAALRPVDRTNILKKYDDLTKNTKDKKFILVSTQVLEAGVDIDLDVIIRDTAPLDSLIQSAGRCNRNYRFENANVFVINHVRDNESKRLEAAKIYSESLLDITQETIKEYINHNEAVSEIDTKYLFENYIERIEKRIKAFQEGNVNEFKGYAGRLEFKEINDKFELIDNFNTVSVLILDNESKRIYEELKTIESSQKDRYQIYGESLKKRKELERYVININIGKLNLFSGMIKEDPELGIYKFEVGSSSEVVYDALGLRFLPNVEII